MSDRIPSLPIDVETTIADEVRMHTLDGDDVVQGSLADAAVDTNAAGTLSAKLRGLVKIMASVLNSTSGALRTTTTDPTDNTKQAKVTDQPAAETDAGIVVRIPRRGTMTDAATESITLGGTAQNALVANNNRRYLRILNPRSATESLWVSYVAAAVIGTPGPSFELLPGDFDEFEGMAIPTNAVSVNAATTGHRFIAQEI